MHLKCILAFYLKDILGEDIRKKILTELQTIERISEVLDLLEVVMGFAGSAGGFQNNKIQNYLRDVLKYSRGQDLLSETVRYNHLISIIIINGAISLPVFVVFYYYTFIPLFIKYHHNHIFTQLDFLVN